MGGTGQAPITARQRNISMAVLFLVMLIASADRFVFSVLIIPIKQEFGVSDTVMGLLTGPAFAILYATLGIPVARLADTSNRRSIIIVAMGIWSIMTALCGVATNLAQLFLFRIGVGFGEAGATPPTYSLISSYYPPQRRAAAFAFVNLGASCGILLIALLGGWILADYGWRGLLLVIGLPGLLIALATHFLVHDDRASLRLSSIHGMGGETLASARRLFAVPAFRYLSGVAAIYGFITYGAFLWDMTFYARSFDMPLADVLPMVGFANMASSIVGLLFGGWIGNFMSPRSLSWLARLPMYMMFFCCPLFILKYVTPDFHLSILFLILGNVVLLGFAGPFTAAGQAVAPESDRGMAAAIIVFLANMIGMGLGPFVSGFMSDIFAQFVGAQSLRYTLSLLMLLFPVASLLALFAARRMQKQEADGMMR